jgi:hypothetical protein
MPGKQLHSKPPPSHGFNRPIDKATLDTASASEALQLLMQNHGFAFSVKSHMHACTLQLMADVTNFVCSSNAEQPSSPSRRNTQTSRSSASRSPLRSPARSAARTSASTLPPPPVSSFGSFAAETNATTGRSSPPPSRHGPASSQQTNAARNPSPTRRVSIVGTSSPRAPRRASVADANAANTLLKR